MYSINFPENSKKYNRAIYLFVNGIDIHKLKAKDSEIVAT